MELEELRFGKKQLFLSGQDEPVELTVQSLSNSSIGTVGPEPVFGRIYGFIGFGAIDGELFRHLTVSRPAFPLSKLKTVEYLYRYQGVLLDIDRVYRFLDKLKDSLKPFIEKIAFEYAKKHHGDTAGVVFHDMTTLYFEAPDGDGLRKTGFSKDGKPHCPQIMTGLLAGPGGYLSGYDIYEGNTYEGDTLIPFIKKISERFFTWKADCDCSENRAKKDRHNREKGLKRLEKRIKSGKLGMKNK
ncbi:MAG: hypothetical protein LBG45_00685 [Dysgonamonadaceae bacterium]|nr:hypothetical protein [Dysgonamonadaceae bacterium]